MYDPARDIYMVSEGEVDRSAEREARKRPRKRDATAAEDGNTEAPDTKVEDTLGTELPIEKPLVSKSHSQSGEKR